MRDTKGVPWTRALAAALGAGVIALGVFHPVAVAATLLATLAALLLPAVSLAALLRVVKFRDRHAYFRLVRPAVIQAFPPAAFGNSSGGRNVS